MDVFTIVLVTGTAAAILVLGAFVQRAVRPPDEATSTGEHPASRPAEAEPLKARVQALEAELSRLRGRVHELERECTQLRRRLDAGGGERTRER